jgi:hypothetical protein
VVLAEKFIKFTNMNLNDLEKQLQELQKLDPSTLTPEQLQEMIEKLSFLSDKGEEMLNDDFTFSIEEETKFEDIEDIEDTEDEEKINI